MKWGSGCAAALLLVIGIAPARCAQWTVSAGASVSQHDWTPAAALEVSGGPHVFSSSLQWQPMAALTAISGRRETWRAGSQRDAWVGSGGVAFSRINSDWFLALQAGASDRITPGLSSHFQFVSSVGWRSGHFQIQLRHVSNGHLARGPNLGESMLLFGLGL